MVDDSNPDGAALGTESLGSLQAKSKQTERMQLVVRWEVVWWRQGTVAELQQLEMVSEVRGHKRGGGRGGRRQHGKTLAATQGAEQGSSADPNITREMRRRELGVIQGLERIWWCSASFTQMAGGG